MEFYRGNPGIRILALLEAEQCQTVNKRFGSFVEAYLIRPLDVYQLDRCMGVVSDDKEALPERRKSERRRGSDRRSVFSNRNLNGLSVTVPTADLQDIIALGPFRVERGAKKALMNGTVLSFTPKEFELFSMLLANPGRVFSTKELIDRFWPSSTTSTKADLYQYIYRIRQEIEEDPKSPFWLLTIRGFGYAFRTEEDLAEMKPEL